MPTYLRCLLDCLIAGLGCNTPEKARPPAGLVLFKKTTDRLIDDVDDEKVKGGGGGWAPSFANQRKTAAADGRPVVWGLLNISPLFT